MQKYIMQYGRNQNGVYTTYECLTLKKTPCDYIKASATKIMTETSINYVLLVK